MTLLLRDKVLNFSYTTSSSGNIITIMTVSSGEENQMYYLKNTNSMTYRIKGGSEVFYLGPVPQYVKSDNSNYLGIWKRGWKEDNYISLNITSTTTAELTVQPKKEIPSGSYEIQRNSTDAANGDVYFTLTPKTGANQPKGVMIFHRSLELLTLILMSSPSTESVLVRPEFLGAISSVL